MLLFSFIQNIDPKKRIAWTSVRLASAATQSVQFRFQNSDVGFGGGAGGVFGVAFGFCTVSAGALGLEARLSVDWGEGGYVQPRCGVVATRPAILPPPVHVQNLAVPLQHSGGYLGRIDRFALPVHQSVAGQPGAVKLSGGVEPPVLRYQQPLQ